MHALRLLLTPLVFVLLISCRDGSDDDRARDSHVQYVALGASEAAGIGATPLERGYVFQIADELDREGFNIDVVNLGIPGAKIAEIRDISLPVALRARPDVLTVFTGVNDLIDGDSASTFEAELGSLLAELQNLEDNDVIIAVANIPNLTSLPRFRDEPDADVTTARIAEYNAAIGRQASRVDAQIINLAGEAFADNEVSTDGFHPSNEGHRHIANSFLQYLIPKLNDERPVG